MSQEKARTQDMRELAERLYAALGEGDAESVRSVLRATFRGHITPGFPLGAGGDHVGADAMMERVWWVIGAHFRVRPEADEYHMLDDGRLLVRGHYRGTGRSSGRRLDAEFIHLITVDHGRISALEQLTDSAAWREALDEDPPGESTAASEV